MPREPADPQLAAVALEVKRGAGPGWFESRWLTLAIAATTGYRYSPDASWIRELEHEIRGDQTGLETPTNAPASS